MFDLPTRESRAAHLRAALPTGAGSLMLAEFNQREAARAPRAMLVSTALSIVTAAA